MSEKYFTYYFSSMEVIPMSSRSSMAKTPPPRKRRLSKPLIWRALAQEVRFSEDSQPTSSSWSPLLREGEVGPGERGAWSPIVPDMSSSRESIYMMYMERGRGGGRGGGEEGDRRRRVHTS